MRQAKKIMGLLLALILVLAMAIPAFAAEANGSIIIQPANNISLAGRTFTAYKLLDAEKVGTGYVYKVPAELKSFYATELKIAESDPEFDTKVAEAIGNMTDDSDELFAFAAKALAACKTANISGTSGEMSGDNYVIPAASATKLASGYYVIENTGDAKPVSALLLDTVTDPEKVITLKADVPDVDKKITSPNVDSTGKNNNVSIGDTVSYEITSDVPDMTGYTKYYFVLHDTLDEGLTFDAANAKMVVKVGGTTLTKCTHTGDAKHENCYNLETSTTDDNKTKIDIIFKNFIQYNTEAMKGKPVTVTYNVTLNENAVIDGANVNSVKLQYSNDPSKTTDGTPENPDNPGPQGPNTPTGETTEKKTQTYTTQAELVKQNADGVKLAGAQFHIQGESMNIVMTKGYAFVEEANGEYWKLTDGSFTTTPPVTNTEKPELDTNKLYDKDKKKYNKVLKNNEKVETKDIDLWVETDNTGIIDLKGLGAGEYTITEVKAPDGYNKLKNPITLTIEWVAPSTADGACTWRYIWNKNNEKTDSYQNIVVNEAGNQMPSTGGIGTTIFYVAGSIMLIGAAVILIAKRRVNAEK